MNSYTHIEPGPLLRALWENVGGEAAALKRAGFGLSGAVLPSIFHVDAIAQATVAAAGLAAAEIWGARHGREQEVRVDPSHAAAAFRSERVLTIDGKAPQEIWGPVSGYFKAGDGRWVQLHCNFPHHKEGVLRILGVAEDRQAVASAIAGWKAEELEREARAAGLCVAFVRTPGEWRSHPQALALSLLPLMEVVRMGEAPPRPFPDGGARPLSGVRVADLTRVIAGAERGLSLRTC